MLATGENSPNCLDEGLIPVADNYFTLQSIYINRLDEVYMVFEKGLIPWNKGIPRTAEEKEKTSKAQRGKHHSPSTEFRKGQPSPRKGKGTRTKEDIAKYLKEYNLKNKDRIKAQRSEYYQNNKEELLKKNQEYRKEWYIQTRAKRLEITRRYYVKLRTEVLNHYSDNDPKCACCGESFNEFLCIDHINGGGAKQRKELGISAGARFYAWLRRNNYPPGYRVLCHNCNQSLGGFGYCPHQN